MLKYIYIYVYIHLFLYYTGAPEPDPAAWEEEGSNTEVTHQTRKETLLQQACVSTDTPITVTLVVSFVPKKSAFILITIIQNSMI